MPADVDDLATAFEDWPKQRSTFEKYADEAEAGLRDVLVARLDGELRRVRDRLVAARSTRSFAADGIPEIRDFNVLARVPAAAASAPRRRPR